jgi:hypothetical protein
MDERRAREILSIEGDRIGVGLYYVVWPVPVPDPDTCLQVGEDYTCIALDGTFTVDELEAVVWWMRNKAGFVMREGDVGAS